MAGYGGREGPDTPGESRGVAVLDPAEDLLSPLLGDSSGDGRDEPARGDGGESARGDGAESAGGDGAESDGVASPHPTAFLRHRADDTDPIAGLTHRDAASRLRHFGANETPSPPPPDERARFLRELRTPAARVVWFALLLQLVQALLDTVADVNRGDLADDDTDDSAGAGRGAPAAWIDAGALLLLLLVNARIARAEERTAEEATRAAVAATARRAVVVRDGEPRDVDAGEIVPGDVVVVDVGDAAPADCRLLDASSAIVEVDVTALANVGVRDGDIDGVPVAETGEDAFLARVPCRRGAVRRLVPGDALLAGAVITRGEARGVVIRTGAKTAIGERATRAFRRTRRANANAYEDSSASAVDRAVRSASRGVFFASAAACGVVFATLLFACRFGAHAGSAGEGSDERSRATSHSNANSDVVSVASFVAALMVAASPTATRAARAATAAVGCRRLARHRAVISRLSAAQHLARMDALVVDDVGTLTADGAELRAVRVFAEGATPRDVLTAAALASRWDEPAKNAVDAMVLRSVNLAPLRESYELVQHQPADSTRPATESRVRRRADGGSAFRACKGSPDVVAAMCDVDDETRDELTARLDECAAAGVRCFAVAAWNGDEGNDRARNGDGGLDREDSEGGLDREFGRSDASTVRSTGRSAVGWTLLGLVSFRDPPRWDAARCVSRARELGVRVVVATRASAATTRETCRLAGLPRRACASRDAPSSNDPAFDRVDALAERLGGYASIRGVASRAWVDGRRDGRERVERDGVGGGGNRRRRPAADAVRADADVRSASGTRRPRARRRRRSRRLREGTKPRRVPRRDVRARPRVSLRRRRGRRRRRVRRVRGRRRRIVRRGGDGGVGGDGRGGGGARTTPSRRRDDPNGGAFPVSSSPRPSAASSAPPPPPLSERVSRASTPTRPVGSRSRRGGRRRRRISG